MKKSILGKLFFAFFALFAFGTISISASPAKSGKIHICATVFPQYDWLRNIIKDSSNVELSLLVQNGTDMHSFQPKVSDIVKISSSDIFVFIGGESDEWVEDVLKNSASKKTFSVSLIDVLKEKGKARFETDEGILNSEEKSGTDKKSETGKSEESENDEHIWLSLKNAVLLCNYLCEVLCNADSKNALLYKKNCEGYTAKLLALDKEFEEVSKNIKKTLVFADRFPFLYLTEDYSLKYVAAFSGCSTETDANFKTILALAKKIDDEKINNVLIIENSKDIIAKTVIKTTKNKNASILVLDSIQSVSKKMIDSGTTYLGVMEKNLEVLKILAR